MAPPEKNNIELERRGDVCVARVRGRIAETEAGILEQKLQSAVEGGARSVVLDLSEAPMITSAGLGAFMAAHKECRAKGGSVQIACAQPLVLQVFETTRLTKLFGLHPTVADALAAAEH